MVPFGGAGVMVLGAVLSGAVLALVAFGLAGWRPRAGVQVWVWAALLWSLTVIALVTLVPAEGAPGIVPAEGRMATCSWDIGGPAPEGFWIFDGGQRTLNTVLFVSSGALMVLAFGFSAGGWVLAPLGLAGLAAYSAAIELVQLELARIDRACDVTDVVDNVTGALIGFGIGLFLLPLVRAWSRAVSRAG